LEGAECSSVWRCRDNYGGATEEVANYFIFLDSATS
jgi:hypothetical protein